MAKKEKRLAVTLVKAASRATFGSVRRSQVISNKKKPPTNWRRELDESPSIVF